MEREDKKMITTSEAAEILNVKPSTIHKYVKEEKLKPVYDDSWHIDTTKLFYLEDVKSLKQSLKKPGITTGKAAELLGLKQVTVFQYIQRGLLKAEKHKYRGREIFFIQPEDLEQFKSYYEEVKKRDNKDFYDRKTGYAWFQSFRNASGDIEGRILLDEEEQPYLAVNTEIIPYKEIKDRGFVPLYPIQDIDYKTRKGFAKFILIKCSAAYETIELFYKYLGPKNMKISIKSNEEIEVEVKPVLLKEKIPDEIIELLEKSLIEGHLIKRLDGLFIDSELEVLSVPVPSKLKELIKEEAKNSDSTMEEIVVGILREKYGFYDTD